MGSSSFYIVSQVDIRLVLESNCDKPNLPLLLRPKCDSRRQLWKWKWKSNAALVNDDQKYVMDVKKSVIKSKRIAITVLEKSDLNQGWHVLDGHVISNRYNLAIDRDVTTSEGIVMRPIDLNASQKWYFVPENEWNAFQMMYQGVNPLGKFLFWSYVITDYAHVIIGCTIDEYRQSVERCKSAVDDCAKILHSVATGTGIAKTVGGSSAVAGGLACVTGIALAPFTAGASLGFTVTGVLMSVSGGFTAATSSFIDMFFDESKKKELQRAITPALTATFNLQNLLDILIESSREAFNPCMDAGDIKRVLQKCNPFIKGGKLIYSSARLGGGLVGCIDDAQFFARLPKLLDSVGNVRAIRLALATEAAAPGFSLGGKTLVATGSGVAKGISASFAVVGILAGVWDIYSGAKQLKNKSELAKKFESASEGIQKDSDKLIEIYNKFCEKKESC